MINIQINLSEAQENFKETAINIIPNPPIIRPKFINWRQKISPIINDIIFHILPDQKKYKKILFVNTIENISKHNFDTKQGTSTLIQILNTIDDCIIIKSYKAYRQLYNNLKLSNNYLTPRSTVIKLARHINAHYVLYSTIYDTVDNIYLDIQLITVQNGEIIWSHIIPI